MNNSYNNTNKYNRQHQNNHSANKGIGRALTTVLTAVFSTTFLGFATFVVLFYLYVTPKDIAYFKTYAKNHAHNLVQNVGSMASNASHFTAETITNLTNKAKENEKGKQPDTIVAKEKPTDNAPTDATDVVEVILKSDLGNVTYFSQTDERWVNTIYGNGNTMGVYGCGPTTVAMLATSLTDATIYPTDAAAWAYDNGQFANNGGSYHSIIATGATNYGLTAQSLLTPNKATLIEELKKGNLIVVLMDKGNFTSGGHFLILRGVTENDEVLIADAKSLENSKKAWDFDIIIDEAKYEASNGGPFWSIGKK